LELGIDKYNQECRKIVMKYSDEWRQRVTRLGRWIDFDNDYKTMVNILKSLLGFEIYGVSILGIFRVI
jgi:isoleucyl-tRNA synthetase